MSTLTTIKPNSIEGYAARGIINAIKKNENNLEEVVLLNEFEEEILVYCVVHDASMLKYIANPSLRVKVAAYKTDAEVINIISNPDEVIAEAKKKSK